MSASTQILPGTGRCPTGAEGSQLPACPALSSAWDPSDASRHVPVPGRISDQRLRAFAPSREPRLFFFSTRCREGAKGAVATPPRHPELVSGSMPYGVSESVSSMFGAAIEAWMLKQGLHDGSDLEAVI